MEVSRSGSTGMDAGRAVMGHGWPVSACPRSGTGVRAPERSEGRTWEPGLFAYFCGCLTKVSRRKGGTRKKPLRIEWIYTPCFITGTPSTYPLQAFNRHIRFAFTASPFWQTAPKGTKRSLPYHPAELA